MHNENIRSVKLSYSETKFGFRAALQKVVIIIAIGIIKQAISTYSGWPARRRVDR